MASPMMSNPMMANPDSLRQTYFVIESPKRIWYFLACLIAVISALQLLSFVHSKLIARRKAPKQLNPDNTPIRHSASISRLPIAGVNFFRVIAFRLTLNIGRSLSVTPAELFLGAAYAAALFTFAFMNTTSTSGKPYQLMYWSTRSGALVASQLPLIVALSTKNNILGVITGLSFEKLNFLHRLSARVVFVLAWVHIGSKIQVQLDYHYIALILGTTWLRTGILAAVSFNLIIFLSSRPVRTKAYEFFLYTHIPLVIILLVGTYLHASHSGHQYYVWPAMLIWGLDRAIRGVRVALSYARLGTRGHATEASAELVSPHLVRLRLHLPKHFRWRAGQFAYLIAPSVSNLPWESHPFTIASTDSDDFNTRKQPQLNSNDSNSGASPLTSSSEKNVIGDDGSKELVFLINVHKGFTHKLKVNASGGSRFKVYVDGPYGLSPDFRGFETSVLIAGGSGVSYTLPKLLEILEQSRNTQTACTKILFVWCIRSLDHVTWISESLNEALMSIPSSVRVEVSIYVTNSQDGRSSSTESHSASSASEEKAGTDVSSPLLVSSAVKVTSGRAPLSRILSEEASITNGRMAVSVCGSHALSRDVRDALRFAGNPITTIRGGPSVQLHVETFGY